MPERIIMALKLSNTVHSTNTGDREVREAPAAIQDSGVGSDHEIYRKLSPYCEHQEVCENYTSQFIRTRQGNCISQ